MSPPRDADDLPTPPGAFELDAPDESIGLDGQPPERHARMLPERKRINTAVDTPYDPYDEYGDEAEGLTPRWSARPLLWLAVGAALVVLIGWGIHRIVLRGMADQFGRTFQNVSLLPADNLKIVEGPDQLQVYYFARGMTLAPYRLKLTETAGPVERLTLVTRALEKAPPGGLLESPLPAGCKVRGVYLLENVAWVDLTEEFLKPTQPTPHLERLTVYALVDSIKLNAPAIEGVRFMVAGRPIVSAWGWLDLSTPLGADLSLIR